MYENIVQVKNDYEISDLFAKEEAFLLIVCKENHGSTKLEHYFKKYYHVLEMNTIRYLLKLFPHLILF